MHVADGICHRHRIHEAGDGLIIDDDRAAALVDGNDLADEVVVLGVGGLLMLACRETEKTADNDERECGVRQPRVKFR